MKFKKLLFISFLAIVFSFVSFTAVPTKAQTIDEVSDPGILPNSSFYFLQNWWQDIKLFFTTNPNSKAELSLDYASQEVLAYQQLAQTTNQGLLDQIMNRYQNRIKQANKWMNEAKEQGNDISRTANKLKDSTQKQIEVLGEVYKQAPETAKQGLETAIENTGKEVGQGLEKTVGPGESMEFNSSLNEALNNAGVDKQIEVQQQMQNQNDRADQGNTNEDQGNSPNIDNSNPSENYNPSGNSQNQSGSQGN